MEFTEKITGDHKLYRDRYRVRSSSRRVKDRRPCWKAFSRWRDLNLGQGYPGFLEKTSGKVIRILIIIHNTGDPGIDDGLGA